jgi:hypothetical protein
MRTKEKKAKKRPRKQMKMTMIMTRREVDEEKGAGDAGGMLRASGADVAGDEDEDDIPSPQKGQQKNLGHLF